MSDPSLSDIDFKSKMALIWTKDSPSRIPVWINIYGYLHQQFCHEQFECWYIQFHRLNKKLWFFGFRFVILGVGFFAVPWSGAKYQLMFDFRCTVNAVLNLFKQYKKFTFVECLACQKVKTGSYILNCQNYIYDIRLVFTKFLYLFETRWTLPSWSLPSFSTAPPATIREMTTLASSFLTVAPRKILFLSIVTEAKLWPAPLKLFASWRASCSTAVTEESWISWSESIPETERSLSSDKNTFNSSASGCVLWI